MSDPSVENAEFSIMVKLYRVAVTKKRFYTGSAHASAAIANPSARLTSPRMTTSEALYLCHLQEPQLQTDEGIG